MSTKNESVIPVAVRQAIIDTMKIQLGLEVHVSVVAVKAGEAEKAPSSLDIMSVMGIKATGLLGSIALGCPQSVFLKLLEAMIGEKHETISAENSDACGELLNIIYASARVKINEAGFDFQTAIPTTVCGSELSLPLGQHNSFMKFMTESPHGPILVLLALKRAE